MMNLVLSRAARRLVAILQARGLHCATAESLTGGMLSSVLTSIPGSSTVFPGGLVCYSCAVKSSIAGVPADCLTAHGPVSRETAQAMAKGACRLFDADVSIALTGVAGPGPDRDGVPAGTVWIALAVRHENTEEYVSSLFSFKGGRAAVRRKACLHALRMACFCIDSRPELLYT